MKFKELMVQKAIQEKTGGDGGGMFGGFGGSGGDNAPTDQVNFPKMRLGRTLHSNLGSIS